MKYLSVKEAADNWGMTARRVQILCNEARIAGAQRVGNVWTIPENAEKPIDARKKIIPKTIPHNNSITIERIWAMPNKHTFEIKPIHDLISEEATEGFWIDPFANRNKLATITNDLSTEFDTDYHLDALDFLKLFDTNSVDGVLYDPPYSPRQVSECYNDVGYNVTWDTTKASFWGNHKKEISRIVKIGGKVITFGWNSGGIGNKYGFEIQRILLVPHGGWHNDTICTVEIKTHNAELEITNGENSMINYSQFTTHTKEDEKLISIIKSLPCDFWDFKDSDTREYTHGIHSYPAMMVCPISRNIISIVKKVKEIDTLFDPFSGSGTVLVEGMLANIPTIYGNDLNPLALLLSKVKTTPLDSSALQNECNKIIELINIKYSSNAEYFDNVDEYMKNSLHLDLTSKEGWGISANEYLDQYFENQGSKMSVPSFNNLGYWFKPRVILLLQLIKESIEETKDSSIRDFAFIAFSETIRLVSNRRNGEFKMFRMPPNKVYDFNPDVIKEFSIILKRNIEKMNSFSEAIDDKGNISNVHIFNNDATSLNEVPDSAADLIITSPPYGDSRTTVAYGEYSRLSLLWHGNDTTTHKEIIDIDKKLMGGHKYRNGFTYDIPSNTLRQSLEKIKDIDIERTGDVYSFYTDLEKSISAVATKTKSKGYQFWVVGNRTVKGENLKTDIIIKEIASKYNLDYIYTIDRNICNKVMPAQNSPTNEIGNKANTMTNEHIVILRKL